MTGKFNHRRSSLLLVALSIAVFLTTSLLIVDGQPYYNSTPTTILKLHSTLWMLQEQTNGCTTMIPATGNTGPTYT